MASPASFRPEGLQAMTRNHFKHLPPSSDLNKVSDAVRKCIEILKKNKISTKELADMITEASEGEVEPNENTLKAFISRSETGRTNKSATLEILFNFFLDNWRSFENPMRAEMAGVWENFVPDLETNGESRRIFGATMEHVFGGLLLNWVGGSQDQISRYRPNLCSEYYLFRRSARVHEAVVRSEVNIECISSKDLKVTHFHHDRNDDIRTSRGFMVPTEGNHIAVLNIENGISIEFLAVKKTPTEQFKRLVGFIVSINTNNVLICARAVLLKKAELDFEPPTRFRFDAFLENGVLNKTLHYLDEDRAMTIPDWQKQLYESIERGNAGGEKH